MATHNTEDSYKELERIVMEKMYALEGENMQLKRDLAVANAKLEVYERIASISNEKTTLGFGPPINREGGCNDDYSKQ